MGIIIGLCGNPGSGKSEVRKILVKEHGFELINSKSIIYELASVATGLPVEHFSDPAYKNGELNGIKLRAIAGNLGYVMEDFFGTDYLIRKSLENHNVSKRTNKNFVIDSLRLDQPVLLQGTVIPVEVENRRAPESTEDYDQYEMPAKGYYVMDNNHNLPELVTEVADLVELIKEDYPHGL